MPKNTMDFLDEKIVKYAEAQSKTETDVLNKLNRETHLKVSRPRMLSGHMQGLFLEMFSVAMQPKRILEIGTYTGYSAICLAEGLQAGGKLHTIDINDELEKMVRSYWKEAGLEDKIEYHLGNALDVLPQLDETFDLVFIDADKKNYLKYFELVVDKVRKDGFILADNVLWSGKVLHEEKDGDTEAIHAFNKHVAADKRVESFLLPMRDGIMMVRKL